MTKKRKKQKKITIVEAPYVEEKPKYLKEDYFELIVDNPSQASPFLKFSWCLGVKGLEYLQEKKVLFPFLLIVVLKKDGYGKYQDYERQLLPLDQGLGNIQFNQPGEYSVNASVISCSSISDNGKKVYKKLHDWYLKKSGGEYLNMVHDGLSYRPEYIQYGYFKLPYHDTININIDRNFFAPEPPTLLKWWVNLFWGGSKPKNQCIWRRRLIIAFLLQPIIIAFFLPLRSVTVVIVTGFFLLKGAYPKAINWKVILHPFDLDIYDIYDDVHKYQGYWWKSDSEGEPRGRLEKLFLCPYVYYFGIFLLWFISFCSSGFSAKDSLWKADVGLILSVMASGYIFLKIFLFVFDKYFRKISFRNLFFKKQYKEQDWDAIEKKEKEEERKQRAIIAKYIDERIAPLACEKRPREASLKSLPASHRTISLRFMDLKSKVCLPFSGGRD